MYWLLFKNFLNSKTVIFGLLVLLLAGGAGIFAGNKHLQKSRQAAARTLESQRHSIERNISFYNKELGLLLYYQRFAFINETPALNGLSIGQRDVNNSIQFLTIRNLESQQYETDLYNPMNLFAGTLDLAFVFIYLFPLFIVAVTYNLLSEEKEAGTWRLAAVQSPNVLLLIRRKLAVRVLTVLSLFLVLLAGAMVVIKIPFDKIFISATVMLVLYLLFWFAISCWVVSWQKESGVNAAALLSIWVMLTIVAPAAINNFIAIRYPLPEAFATAVDNREGFHEKWDLPKSVAVDKFFKHYPQFSHFKQPVESFDWLWYYAMQQAGDDDASQAAAALRNKLQLRSRITSVLAAFFPTMHTQLQLNDLSSAGLANYIRFLASTGNFHEQLRLQFYPQIFAEMPVMQIDWKKDRSGRFQETVSPDWLVRLLPPAVATAFFSLLAWLGFRRKATVE